MGENRQTAGAAQFLNQLNQSLQSSPLKLGLSITHNTKRHMAWHGPYHSITWYHTITIKYHTIPQDTKTWSIMLGCTSRDLQSPNIAFIIFLRCHNYNTSLNINVPSLGSLYRFETFSSIQQIPPPKKQKKTYVFSGLSCKSGHHLSYCYWK